MIVYAVALACNAEEALLLTPEGKLAALLRRAPQKRLEQEEVLRTGGLLEIELYRSPEGGPFRIVRQRAAAQFFGDAVFGDACLELVKKFSETHLTCVGLLPAYLTAGTLSKDAWEIPPAAVFLRFVHDCAISLGSAFDVETCGGCGHVFNRHSLYFFHPERFRMDCSVCADGGSCRLESRTYQLMKDVLILPYGELLSLEYRGDSLDYLAFLFFQSLMYRFGNLPKTREFFASLDFAAKKNG